MKPKDFTKYLLPLVLLLFLGGCNVTKHFPANEYLLTKNKIKINNRQVSSDELSGYIQQTPNSKLFGLFRTNIACYNYGNQGKDSKFKTWMRLKAGTPPVILDTNLTTISLKQMKLYLNNKGYFHSNIRDSVVYHKKKAKVYYLVETSKLYLIHDFVYSIPDTQLAHFVFQDTSKSLIKRGAPYDSYILDNERSRITNSLMNQGFYKFSTAFIKYRIDSSLDAHQVNISLQIINVVVPSIENFGVMVELPHKRFLINKIFIHPDFDLLQSDTVVYDTLKLSYQVSGADTIPNTYYFLYVNKMKIHPATIAQGIFIRNGSYYNLLDINQTYSQLSSLNVFKYISIQLHEVPGNGPNHENLLDCHVQLALASVQSFMVSPDVTNSAGSLGLQANFSYSTRNIFHGAQFLKLSLNAAAQAQGTIGSANHNQFFNTLELGGNVSLTLPQFLIPIRQWKLPKSFKPKTVINIGFDFQQRTEYSRSISNVAFGYTWTQNNQIRHILNPMEIIFVKAVVDSAFSAQLNKLSDKRYKNQYTDHLVAGLKYSITFSNQMVNTIQNFFYIRSNFETGGNLIYGVNELLKSPKNANGNYTLFNIQYAQFVRPDLDLRYYHLFNSKQTLVLRFYGGIGFPYGNSNVLPFEKAFFAGGSNDIRGWKLGTLGPGAYHNDTLPSTYDQSGDLQLQGNIELRFPVYKWIKSAVFLDMGNVWMRQSATDFPGGKFDPKTVLSQVAIDLGIGVRLDFDYFIFRLDPAVPIRVPYYANYGHWYLTQLNLSDIMWNFGIGYPF
ncbi:MAG: BamA/TamA family outer membrane protein [Bacteroidetes bacterium]|nr:BamA/TamA family outer membrane protein [Bacteroidota bacterium]